MTGRSYAIGLAAALILALQPWHAPRVSTLRAQEASATPEQRYFDWTELPFSAEDLGGRRARLLEALRQSGGGILLVLSADGLSHGDTFRQSDDFYYLTGLELPRSVLVLDADLGAAILFAPDRDFRFENPSRPNDFPGRPLGSDSAIGLRAGIADIRPKDDLDAHLLVWMGEGRTLRLNVGAPGPIDPPTVSLAGRWTAEQHTVSYLLALDPRARIQNAFGTVARVRAVKSTAEIRVMRRAAQATARSIVAGARSIEPGVTERDLEAAFEASCKREGAQRVAFASIIKSGPNALWPWRILASHYDRRNRALAAGDLVIFDVGCELDQYVSDVGRTFPVSGRFTQRQREILTMEVGVADAIIAAIRPGTRFAELRTVALKAIPDEHRPYMQVGLFFGHHLGLSTGDPVLTDEPLQPGMVFTVEPWYYNHAEGISVFTEDEVLVTEDGAEALTAGLPRSPDALEALVNSTMEPR